MKVKIKADSYITARTVQSKPLKVNSALSAANVQSKWRMRNLIFMSSSHALSEPSMAPKMKGKVCCCSNEF